MEDAQSETAPNGAASGSAGSAGEERRVFPPPRKLSDEQEVEVTRLYAETNTPIADIAGRFRIGESSVYRVAKRHGAALRGRVGRSSGGADNSSSAAAASADGASQSSQGTSTRIRCRHGQLGRHGCRGAPRTDHHSPPTRQHRRPRPMAAGHGAVPRQPRAGGERRRFRVSYLGVVVVEASGIREALVIAESQGAQEVTSVHREE